MGSFAEEVKTWDPNTDLVPNVWGVYTQDGFVTYKNRGPALNAFMHEYGPAALWELAHSWVVRAYKPTNRLDFGQRACDVCAGRPLAASPYTRGPTAGPEYAHGHWAWRRENGKITSPPELLFVCYTCLQRVS